MTSVAGLVPALDWLPRYDKRWLRADIIGGLSAGAVVIPQAMAYATIADLAPALDAVDADTVVLEMSAVAKLSVSAAMQFADLDREIRSRGAVVWIAAVPPQTLAVARDMPRFVEIEAAGQVFPTALAAMRAYRETRSS